MSSEPTEARVSADDARSPLGELTKARLREFLREPGYVFWVFGFPLLMAIGLGLAFRERAPEPPRVAVVRTVLPSVADAVLGSKQLVARAMTREEAHRALGRANIDLVVEGGPDVRLRYDAGQERGRLARALVNEVIQRSSGRRDVVPIHDEHVLEQGNRYVDFLLPGLIGLNLMGSSMWGIGFNFVLARKRRLLRRYAVTPMRRSDFLLAYFISRCVFLVFELGLLIAFGRLVFGTVIRGSALEVLIASVLGAAAFAAIGLLIGARLDNTEIASGWMNFVQLPMWLLSGTFFSYERFPEWLQAPIRLLPLTAINDALRAIYNDGSTLLSCRFELAVLAAWTLIGFGIAVRIFRWQ